MGMAYQDVSFKTRDGLTLRGWWIPGTMHQSIVMIHGLSNNREEPLNKAGYLHKAGYNILVFDLRGHGQSDGNGTTMGYLETEDARAAVAEARSLDSGPIALFGYSLGAAIAIEEAALNPDVSAVIEDSGFSSIGDVFMATVTSTTGLPSIPFAAPVLAYGQMDIGASLWSVSPAGSARHLDKPLLAIISDNDNQVPPAEGRAIYAAAVGPKEMLDVTGGGHVGAYYFATSLYQSTVLDFLNRSL